MYLGTHMGLPIARKVKVLWPSLVFSSLPQRLQVRGGCIRRLAGDTGGASLVAITGSVEVTVVVTGSVCGVTVAVLLSTSSFSVPSPGGRNCAGKTVNGARVTM